MNTSVRTAMALWFVLAIVVFSVRFDWQTRMAGHIFVRSQGDRHQQGLPTLSIDDAFRPMVNAAARDAAVWFLVVAAAGTIGAVAAGRRHNAS
jgi:hypothetical protein